MYWVPVWEAARWISCMQKTIVYCNKPIFVLMSSNINEKLQGESHACRKLLFTATNICSYLCRPTQMRSCKVNLMHAENYCLLRQTYIRTYAVQHKWEAAGWISCMQKTTVFCEKYIFVLMPSNTNEKLQGEFHACRFSRVLKVMASKVSKLETSAWQRRSIGRMSLGRESSWSKAMWLVTIDKSCDISFVKLCRKLSFIATNIYSYLCLPSQLSYKVNLMRAEAFVYCDQYTGCPKQIPHNLEA